MSASQPLVGSLHDHMRTSIPTGNKLAPDIVGGGCVVGGAGVVVLLAWPVIQIIPELQDVKSVIKITIFRKWICSGDDRLATIDEN